MTLPALVARVTVILAATGRAPAARPVGELRGVLGSHAPRGNNDDDDNHDDNYCQDDHELSHRTIQHGMASQGGASEAHVAIDADLSPCASTLSNSLLNTWTVILSHRPRPCPPLLELYPPMSTHCCPTP